MPSSVPERIRPTAWKSVAAWTVLLFAALWALAWPVGPVRAASTLTDPSVSPSSGPVGQLFTFSIHFRSSSPARPPDSIVAQVGATYVPLTLVAGSPSNGTYAGSTDTLALGTHSVTFGADVVDDPPGDPAPVDGGVVTVTAAPTPPPATPTPAPTPTPPPTPVPTATAQPTPRPPGVTPRPTPRPTPLPPGVTPAPATPTPGASADESQGAGSSEEPGSASPAPTGSTSGEARPSVSPGDASAEPGPSPDEIDDQASRGGFGQVGWIVLGGMTSVAGAAVLGRQWLARRRG